MTLLSIYDVGASIMDAIVVVWLVLGLIIGFWTGFLDRTIKIVEMFVVVIIASLFKNPLSALLYKHLPFFKFDIQVINILIYEAIAFILLIIILVIIIKIINSLINLVQSFFSFILNLGFPSKILGAIIGFCEGAFYLYIFVFIVLFLSAAFDAPIEPSFANKFFYNAPVLNVTIGPPLNSCIEIAEIANKSDKKEYVDSKSFEVLLKYKILSKENAKYLIDNKKITITDAEDIINLY